MLPFLLIAGHAAPRSLAPLCGRDRIAASAAVSDRPSTVWPDYPNGPVPDAATIARREAHDLAAFGLVPLAGGVTVLGGIEARWPGACRVALTGVRSSGARTVDGIAVSWGSDGHVAAEPPHPDLPHARFIGSAATSADGWRLGVWRLGRADYRLAAYRPGAGAAPLAVVRSTLPVAAISYLPTPEGRGGAFTVLQRIGRNAYRRVALGWTGQGELPPGG